MHLDPIEAQFRMGLLETVSIVISFERQYYSTQLYFNRLKIFNAIGRWPALIIDEGWT